MAVRGPVVAVLLESIRAIGGTVADAHLQHLARDGRRRRGRPARSTTGSATRMRSRAGAARSAGTAATRSRTEMIDDARQARATRADHQLLLQAGGAAARRPCCGRPGAACRSRCSTRTARPCRRPIWRGLPPPSTYDRLLDAGVADLREPPRRALEDSSLVDDAWAAFGSYNFEDAAHDRLAEAMLASRDARAVAPVAAIFSTSCGQTPTTCP